MAAAVAWAVNNLGAIVSDKALQASAGTTIALSVICAVVAT